MSNVCLPFYLLLPDQYIEIYASYNRQYKKAEEHIGRNELIKSREKRNCKTYMGKENTLDKNNAKKI